MHWRTKILTSLLPVLLIWGGSLAARADGDENAAPATAGSAPPSLLHGGVKHSDELPGLMDDLRPGKVYSDDLLLKGDTPTNNVWFYIPPWFAGVRHAETQTVIYAYDYKTGASLMDNTQVMNRQDALSGYQRDKNGGIWDYKHVPTLQHIESVNDNAVMYVSKIKPLMESRDRLDILFEEIAVAIDKTDGTIISAKQQEQINSYTSPQPGILRIDTSTKIFDRDGKPETLALSVGMAKMSKGFEPVNEFEGKDLRPLFLQFLLNHHLGNLVPDELIEGTNAN